MESRKKGQLVLGRKADEQIIIGNDIVITVVEVNDKRVRLLISAPKEMKVLRGELLDRLQATVPVRKEVT